MGLLSIGESLAEIRPPRQEIVIELRRNCIMRDIVITSQNKEVSKGAQQVM